MPERPGIVLDTGIVLQAVLRPAGPAGRLVSLVDRGLFYVYLSDACVSEYRDVLRRPAVRAKNPHLTDELAEAVVTAICGSAVLVPDPLDHSFRLRDPNDEHIVNLAVTANADYIVSRDNDLLDLVHDGAFIGRFPRLRVVDPVAFLHEMNAQNPRDSEPPT
jgi:putative PIN family toxin of toxin-antitoxin system